jgi:cold shock CspA family protein
MIQTRQAILNMVYSGLQDGLLSPDDIMRVTDQFCGPANGKLMHVTNFVPPNSYVEPMSRRINEHVDSKRYVGQLQNYSQKNGYGFLTNPQTKAKYNQDVFLHKAQYEALRMQSGGYLELGVWVEFSIEEKDGKPQARDVMLSTHQTNFRI